MNILHHKSWHVRTKDNIARVRKDEAKAAEEAKDLEKRIKLADQEARTNFLRKKARDRIVNRDEDALDQTQKVESSTETASFNDLLVGPSGSHSSVNAPSGHVNFFQDLEEGEKNSTTNKDREQEEKKEKEEYEKKIGLLTYLGQDTHELTGNKSWWQKIPEKRSIDSEVKEENIKQQKHLEMLDPLSSLRKHLGCKGVQSIATHHAQRNEHKSTSTKKKRKRKSSSSSGEEGSIPKTRNEKYKKKRDKKDKSNHSHKSSNRKDKKSSKSKRKKKDKHKKRKRSSSDSDSEKHVVDLNNQRHTELEDNRLKIDKLRRERNEREKKSRDRRNELLYGVHKSEANTNKVNPKSIESNRKYNTQFNPQFAKQNKLDASNKYWLQ